MQHVALDGAKGSTTYGRGCVLAICQKLILQGIANSPSDDYRVIH